MASLDASSRNNSSARPRWARRKAASKLRHPRNSSARISSALDLSACQDEHLRRHNLVVVPAPKDYGRVPTQIYSEIYEEHLPVLITADSILYAFHRRYVNLLSHLERSQLRPAIARVLQATQAHLHTTRNQDKLSATQLARFEEIEFYLEVAYALIQRRSSQIHRQALSSRVQETLRKIDAFERGSLDLFGQHDSLFDFSQFKPRGHYEENPTLRAYFQTIMWLAKARVELSSIKEGKQVLNVEAFNIAATLSLLLQESGQAKTLDSVRNMLDTLVGPDDDENALTMADFLQRAGVQRLDDIEQIPEEARLAWLREHAKERSRIVSHARGGALERANPPTARNFVLLGQRYTLDSEIFQRLVYDKLFDPIDAQQTPIKRKLPKALDIMAALGNPRAMAHLKSEFLRFPYQRALQQLQGEIQDLPSNYWVQNVHSAWLDAIASLHQNSSDPRLAPVFRSKAWQDKTLQTQLGSWTELRHDHILYAKQSESSMILCEYPDAYVEPVPHTYAKIKRLVGRLHAAIDKLETANNRFNPRVHQDLEFFVKVMDTLTEIAQRELDKIPLSQEQMNFLKQTVEKDMVGCGSVEWDGWYPRLVGGSNNISFEPVTADVHTDPPDITNNHQGRVLQVGTGAFEVAMIRVPCKSQGQCAYAGPVYSFYEFIQPEKNRLTDSAWRQRLDENRQGPRPSWIQSFRKDRSCSNPRDPDAAHHDQRRAH